MLAGVIDDILICSVQAVLEPTRSSMQWVIKIISSGVKRSEPEDENSPLIIAEVNNAQSYICSPSYAFLVLCLIKNRDFFTCNGYTRSLSLSGIDLPLLCVNRARKFILYVVTSLSSNNPNYGQKCLNFGVYYKYSK